MESSVIKTLGEVVRDLRVSAGMSQVVFGEKCGFYQTYLSRIENGRANPTVNALEVIASGLGITLFALWDLVKERYMAQSTKPQQD